VAKESSKRKTVLLKDKVHNNQKEGLGKAKDYQRRSPKPRHTKDQKIHQPKQSQNMKNKKKRN